MDGTDAASIGMKVEGGKFEVSYRREYLARDTDMPGAALTTRNQAIKKFAAQNPEAIDPLLAFMDLGMRRKASKDSLAKQRFSRCLSKTEVSAGEQGGKKGDGQSYAVDFAVDLKDLDLKLDSDGVHKGEVNVSLIAYDRYRNIGSRKDFLVPLNIKPDVYAHL